MSTINYTPPPTLREFIKDYRQGELFYDWIVGPVGSGKTRPGPTASAGRAR
jgi:hypothetical protein